MNKIKYTWVIISVCLLFCSFFVYVKACSIPRQSDRLPSDTLLNSIIVPDVPHMVSFAGRDIDLKRYDMYERFDRELTAFCYNHSNTLLIIKRANRFFPQIDSLLSEVGIPNDFKYLVAIESYLNQRAVSPAKAVGLWQIMPETGKELGLEVNDFVDERYDIEKATSAASRYLKTAYEKYGDWATAAASYNGGLRRITTEMDAQKQNSFFDLLMNEETSRYVFRILALKEVMSRPQEYGFRIKKNQLYKPIRTFTVPVSTEVADWTAFAQNYGVSYAQLKDFNPWLRDRKLPNKQSKSYLVKVPFAEDLNYGNNEMPVYQQNWVID